MVSQQRNAETAPMAGNAIPEERILDAAYELFLGIGMSRMTMADVARLARVSRATLYRRWTGVNELVAALMTREWARLGTGALEAGDAEAAARTGALEARGAEGAGPAGGRGVRESLVAELVRLAGEVREHPLLRKIIDVDPQILLPYLLHRRGTNTNLQLDTLERAIRAGVADGSIRPGDAAVRAQAVLLTTWSFVLTGPVVAESDTGVGALDEQLGELLERYLAP